MLVFLTLLCFNVNAGTIDPYTEDTKYIEYGKNFNCILQIQGYDSDSRLNMASCVLIHESWILTAAHVVAPLDNCSIKTGSDKIIIEKVFIPKVFKMNKFGAGDIALGRLKTKINLDKYPTLYTERNELGKVCEISGFGVTGNFLTGPKMSDGKRRAGRNKIEEIRSELLVCSPSRGRDKLELEFLISHGDSGGGLFIDNKLAGISSCVMASDKNPDSSYTDEGCHTRVSGYIAWIKEIIDNYEK